MTVESFADPVTYAYTGAGDFTFSFRVFDAADLLVVHRSTSGVTTELVKDTDYTVTVRDSSPYGGTVHCTYPATTGYLVIRRELAFTQETDWVNNDSLDAEILERAFDRVTMLLQQIQVDVDEGGALTNWRGEWVTATDYAVQDLVTTDTGVYVCTEEHTSAAAFSTDLTAGRWIIVLDPSLLTTPGLPFIASGDANKFVRVKTDESGYELTDDVEAGLGNPASDGMVLSSTAAGVRSWRSISVGPLAIQVFTSSGTYTKTSGATVAIVEVVGGGGSGGGSGASLNNAAGGGAGGYARERLSLSGITTVSVTVGAGGAGVSGNTTGNAGGTSSFGAYCSATGGTGGAPNYGSPGVGGVGSGGDLNLYGGGGHPGVPGSGGQGGASYFGGAARRPDSGSAAAGSGGCGASETISYTSGAGMNGIVIVTEY